MDVSLDDYYDSLEARFKPKLDLNYDRLVVANGAAAEPVHRWFHMKEAYSPYLLPRIIKDLALDGASGLKIHDPFLGSGTTLVSSMLSTAVPLATGSGTEVNPFLALVASAKLRALSLESDARDVVRAELLGAGKGALTALRKKISPGAKPALAAFNDERYFSEDKLNDLLRLRAVWEALPEGLSKDLIGVALGGCVEPCSNLRRDGRALRYQENKAAPAVEDEFERRIRLIAEDLDSIAPSGESVASLQDGLLADAWPSHGSLDLVCFSPPYPNNIDYTEVYKMEAWFLGLIADQGEFREQRHRTMRSHPSIKFQERIWTDMSDAILGSAKELVYPIVSSIPDDRYRKQRVRVVEGFIEDCAVVLDRSYKALKPGGHVVYIVGNSRHGVGDSQYTIASDVLMAELATRIGFDVEHVRIARNLHRRGRHNHLRESVVSLKKPQRSGE